MENDNVFRHELKYLINRREMDCCLSRLSEFAEADIHAKNGTYAVRSLYFDDQYRSAYNDKESGVRSRAKYRIRVYDLDQGYITLEKKIKEGMYVRKESAYLSKNEYDMIMSDNTDFLLARSERVANDFAIECRVNGLHPEVIVDYDRIPFVYAYGNVRITFDMNIRSSFDKLDVFAVSTPAYNVLGEDELVMEVKYTEYLPDIIRVVLPDSGCRMAVSKYVLCDDVKLLFREDM